MSHYAASSFVRVHGDVLEIFVSGRDSQNESRIGRVHAKWNGHDVLIMGHDEDPVLDVGEVGCFDESGVSYPWIVQADDHMLMYYVGWVAGGKVRFQNNLGCAISTDGESWERVSRAPIMERTHEEPYGVGSCCVVPSSEGYRMLYTSFEPWVQRSGAAHPRYRIKSARSMNGIDWIRDGKIVVDFADEHETVIGKPMLMQWGDRWKLWYSYRGDSYRIGYAVAGADGGFERLDENVGITVSKEGWDSEMVEYAFVFASGRDVLMAYNGNNYGKTGLGFALLDKDSIKQLES
jgi:hypothetical protein